MGQTPAAAGAPLRYVAELGREQSGPSYTLIQQGAGWEARAGPKKSHQPAGTINGTLFLLTLNDQLLAS